VDRVLSVVGPGFSSADAVQLAAECFGVAADSALDVGSERDQAFMLGANGSSRWVLKVSNAAEDPATLQMEAEAARHAALVEPALSIAQPITSRDGGALARTERGAGHWLRLYDVIPGRARVAATDLDDAALRAWGATSARLTRAMRSFFHPSARRTMLWDVQHAHEVRPLCEAIADSAARQLVERALDQFAHVVQPRWLHLRSQVVHGDLTTDNALVDDSGRITGIVDFGDMCFSALASDLVAVLDSLGSGRSGDELRRAGTLVIDGYQTEIPLEPLELEVLPAMWAARAAVGVAISWWRSAEGLEDAAFAQRYNESALAQIDTLLGGSVRFDGAARGDGAPRSVSDLAERRAATFGPAIESLTYDEPLIVDRAEGCWIFDHAGRRLLDLYNNVPCVGHAHPRVAEAIARQSRRLNTNLRYLHEGAVSLAERLCATFPAELDTVLLVNSGSEANDLAWRLARQYTGNHGALCTAHAYHGITEATAALSPEMLPGHRPPDHVGPWLAPDTYRGIHLDTSEFRGALDALAGRGLRPALTILDGVLQSDGVHDLDPGYVGEIVELTRRAGGVFVADEVQGGFGRTGTHLWSFERFGITPDIVTLGKPMGNGHPVAAVITRRQIAAAFAAQGPIFSTFGGNQVSVAAAHAVLDVIRDERLLDRVVRAGVALRSALGEVCAAYECVGEVRGIGLACAVEIVTDRRSRNPDARRADALKNALRRHGVLVGTTGIDGNVLKVRPPLALDVGEHVDVAAAGFSMSLAEVAGRG
jgi:4-aminobutyrate aminotransferase-like enzyme/tRNA A-37 threonylcarbamoyl transferase component Bud32